MTEGALHTRRVDPRPILVVSGSVHFDVVVQLPDLPRENDRLVPGAMTLAPGGMGGNVAAAFARLGGQSRFAGAFADDNDGRSLRDDLARDGVDVQWAGLRPGRDYRGFILVGAAGARAIIGGWPRMTQLERAPGQVPGDVLHLGDEGGNATRGRWAGMAAVDPGVFDGGAAGFSCPFNYGPLVLDTVPDTVPVFMDLETGHIDGWPGADVWDGLDRAALIFANHRNMAGLAVTLGEPSPTALSRRLETALVETTGPAGCVIHNRGVRTAVPGHRVEPVDTTGAGDCFAAAFVMARLRGHGLADCARFANVAAALSTRALGSRAGVPDAAAMSELTGRVAGLSIGLDREMEAAVAR